MVFNNFFLVNGIYFPQSFRQCQNFHNKGPEMLKRCKFAFFASYLGTSSTCQLLLNVSWSRSFSYLVETPESYTMFDIYNASNQTVGLMTNFECPPHKVTTAEKAGKLTAYVRQMCDMVNIAFTGKEVEDANRRGDLILSIRLLVTSDEI